MSQSLEQKKDASTGAASTTTDATNKPVAESVPGGAPATHWYDWFNKRYEPLEWFAQRNAREAEANSDRKFREEANLQKTPVNYFGTNQPVRGDDGQIKTTPTNGDVTREEQKGVWSWMKSAFTWSSGTEAHLDDGKRQATGWNTSQTTVGAGGYQKTDSVGNRVEVVDVRATGDAVKKELQNNIALAQQEIANLEASKTGDKDADKKIDAKIDAARVRAASAQRAIDDITNSPKNALKLKQICEQQGVYVEAKTKVVSEDSLTTDDKLAIDWAKGSGSMSSTTTKKSTDLDAKTNQNVITTETRKTATDVDVAGGKVSRSSSSSETKQKADGSSSSESSSSSKSVAVGGGAATYSSSSTETKTEKDTKGEVEKGSSTTHKTDASIVAGEDGLGFKGGNSSSASTTKGENTNTIDKDAHVGVTDKGLLGDASIGGKSSGKSVEREFKASADGAILIEVVPPADGSSAYQVVTTIRAGLKLNESIGSKKEEGAEEGGTKGSASFGANAGATMTYSHAMTREEAMQYMSEADKAEASTAASGGGKYPEFGIIEKLNLIAHGEERANPASVLGSSSSAAAMKPGDSVSLVLTAGVQGKLGAEAGSKDKAGGGIDVSGGVNYTRTLKVARDKDGTVIVTIGFVDANKLEGSVSGNLEGAGAKVGASHDASDGEEYTFKLDPTQADYQSCYGAITSAFTRETVKALYSDPKMTSHAEKRKLSDDRKDGTSVEMSGGGVAISSGHSHQGSREIEVSKDGPSGTVSGGATDSFGVKAGVNLGNVSETNTATGTVDDKGELSVDLQKKDTENAGFFDKLHGAGEKIKGWFGIKDDEPTKAKDVIKGALEKTPGERVKELLDQQYTRLSGYKLAPHDVDKVIARAEDETKWMHACVSYHALEPMRTLRAKLLAPQPDMSLVTDPKDEVQLAKATKLAQAQALADFMEKTGSYGMEAIENVLRRWGETWTRESTADDIGLKYEWPQSLSKYRLMYETAEQTVSHMPELFSELSEKPDGAQKWHELSDKQIKALDAIHAAVAESKDIKSERARAEMLDACSNKKAQFTAGAKYFDHATAKSTDPKAASSATEASEGQVGLEMFAQARIPTLLGDLAGFKMKEREMFQEGYKALDTWISQDEALPIMSQLRELYEFWVSKVKELRQAYQIAKVPPEQWKVSVGPDDKRHTSSTEPYVDGMIEIYKKAGGGKYDGDPNRFAAEWKQRYTHY